MPVDGASMNHSKSMQNACWSVRPLPTLIIRYNCALNPLSRGKKRCF